jgi:hypothetical protein
VRLAHHLHAPAQAIQAVRTGVPVLVLIREPRGAILSQLVREPHVALADALVAYARFYECLMPYRNRLVVADFAEVTEDFGSVVRRLNERFGTSYAEFVPSEEHKRECLDLITWRGTLSKTLLGFESGLVGADAARRERDHLTRERTPFATQEAWIPSRERDGAKAALLKRWQDEEMASRRERAERAYHAFLDG